MRGLPPSILRLPDLDREAWARLAALGRFLSECAARSQRGYVQTYWRQAGPATHTARISGAREWYVCVRDAHGKTYRHSGATLEEAFERACVRLVSQSNTPLR